MLNAMQSQDNEFEEGHRDRETIELQKFSKRQLCCSSCSYATGICNRVWRLGHPHMVRVLRREGVISCRHKNPSLSGVEAA